MMQAGRELDKRDATADLAMCEAATPGPWELDPEGDDDEGLVIWRKDAEHPGRSEGVIVLNPDCYYEDADITFITEAREALPYWINVAKTEIGKNEQLVEMWNRMRLIAEKNCWDNITRLMDDLERETRS